ncbi:hypothetical protein H310_04714 [Aphanomyces invadans]|uniref:Mitochondrial carrier protein n=1 Tax=Aphanomyces invadans TaxID=157072 RepID=A0A024UE32_9STRA|nr:hypothetical protein H310_04714 [Aphanomyces invadans]ETW04440.1 hypothetical protein H310_04714 [Aphanomyces invadans]|eukprot:XP_008867396.1 hypothetical protein H310_04714 [Aphanomyces invadans]
MDTKQTTSLMTCATTHTRTWQSVTAGVFAGCVTRSCTSPLDVLKILFQVNGMKGGGSIKATVMHVYHSRGPVGFWKGNLAGCCRLGPYSGVKFCLYDQLQSLVVHEGSPTSVERAVCGAVAGMVATMVVYPMELIRTRLIVNAQHTTSISREIRSIVRHDGVKGLYRGCLSGLVGSIPFEGIQFACYDYGKKYAVDNRWPSWRWPNDKTHLHTVDHFVLGSFAGAAAQSVAYPFDTVKKRLQMQTATDKVYDGIIDCFRKVVQEEGTIGLYRGSLANMVRLVPYAAVMFASYEAAKDFLQSL